MAFIDYNKVDELYMESCEGTSSSAFCDFTAMVLARSLSLTLTFWFVFVIVFVFTGLVLARREETEGQEWFKHWRKMNAKMEWQFDPMSVTHISISF